MEEDLVKLSYLTSMLKQETDCAICLQTLKDPITTKCMHNFCNACISRVIKGNKSTVCPLCNSPIYRRGTATNVKIQHIVKKISPIIESIKNDSPVEILSYYKGKATPSLADDATKMGSVDPAEINCNGADRSHSRSVIDITDTSARTSMSKGSRMSNASDNGITPGEGEKVSFHNFDSVSEVEHLSVSQNVLKTHSRKSSVDIPVSGNVKSPAKKVKEWLTKNSTKDCSSSDGDGPVHKVVENLSTVGENEADESKRADASLDELHVNRSFGSRSTRKVYKGIKKSKLDLKNRGSISNKRGMSIEHDLDFSNEEKDIIQDSCPVEINDTFDKLVSSARHKTSSDVFSPLVEETENQNNSIGLFESLPMPDDGHASKRKRTSKKLKLDTSGDLISGLNSEKYTNKRINDRKGGIGVCDKRSGGTDVRNNVMNDSNLRISQDIIREGSEDDMNKKVSATSCKEKIKEGITSLNFNRSIIDDSEVALAKPGKRRLDISTPKWPHFDNTLKDFHESRKVILPVLDVSVGDPHKASKNQQKLRTTSSGSLEKVPCNNLADIENNCVQSGTSEGIISPKTMIDAKNMPEVISSVIQDSSFVPARKRLSYPRKDKKAEVTVSSFATSGRETPLPICKKIVDTDHVDVQPTNDSFNYAHQSIDTNKTSDESPMKNKGENPRKGILTPHVQSLEKNFQCPSDKLMEYQSMNPTHRKKLCSPVKKCIGNAKSTASEKVENQLIIKPKKLVPFLKLRRLSYKKCQGPRVKFLTLGSLRSFDSSKKMHDASILTDSLTSPGMRDSLVQTSVGIQTESIEIAEPLSNERESKKGNVDTASLELNASCSSSSSVKLKKILKNVKSDLEANRKELDYRLSDDICEIPETTSITPGYVGESDLSDNESSGKKEDSIDVDVHVISYDKAASDEDSDCIVEGSQKNNITLERPLVKARPISLVASALIGREVAQVRQFAEAFNLHFSPQFNGFENTSDLPCTTHVVTKEDAAGKTFCTFKYLCGMISGCWIVSLKWVIDSLAANKVLDEKPYEFLDACGNSKTYRELHGPKKLFKDFQFIYKEPFSILTVQQLKDVIELGGGKIYGPESKPPQINRKYLAIADASVVDSSSGFCKFLFYEKIAVLSCEWVLECIEEYRILSISNYVLNIDYESDPLEICEKLLEMGYDKDLVTIEE